MGETLPTETKEIIAMASFSIKQIKAILSGHNMPVEELDAAAEEICGRHTADLDSIKEERDNLRKDTETLASLRKELEDLKGKPGEDYKAKYEKAKKDLDDYKAEIADKEALAAKKEALKKLCEAKEGAYLSETGVAKALKYSDYSKIELDDKGEIKNAKELAKSLREEWKEHAQSDFQKGARTPNPPAGGSTGIDYSDIRKLTAGWHAAKYGEAPKSGSDNGAQN
jgi:DNA-binding transcriptional MerR regulator